MENLNKLNTEIIEKSQKKISSLVAQIESISDENRTLASELKKCRARNQELKISWDNVLKQNHDLKSKLNNDRKL